MINTIDREQALANRDELVDLLYDILNDAEIPVRRNTIMRQRILEVHWRDRVMTIQVSARRFPSVDFADDDRQCKEREIERKNQIISSNTP